MLRISTHHEPTTTIFVVEGRLAGPWVAELERCWLAATSNEPPESIHVDLNAVTYIDAQGKELLTQMRRNGAMLLVSGLMMNAIVDAIEEAVSKGVSH